MDKLNYRIKYLDLLRFLGFFIVFTFHVIIDMHIHEMHDFSFFLNNIYARPNFNFGMIGMIFFFLASGASLTMSANKNKKNYLFDFYKKRFFKLLIPFYVTYILYFIIRVILHRTTHIFHNATTASPFSIIFTIFGMDEYFNACGISNFSLGIGEWYLGCILLCYLLFPLLYHLYKKRPVILFIFMTLYFVIVQGFIVKCNIAPHQNFFNHIYNFFLGMCLVNNKIIKILIKNKKIFLFAALIFIMFFFLYPKKFLISENIIMTIAATAIYTSAFLIDNILDNSLIISKFLLNYSKIGLELFLVHHFVIYEVNYVLNYPYIEKKIVLIYLLDIALTYVFARLVAFLTRKIVLIKHYF